MNGMRWLPRPALTVTLALLWLLLNNSFGLGHLLLGLFIGWAVPLLCAPVLLPVPRVRRPLGLLLYVLRVFGDILVANLHVARLVVGPRARLRPAFVEVPMACDDDFVQTVLASVISLTPGTVSAAFSSDRRRLLVHALDAPSPEALVEELKTRYEAPLLEIFACSK